MQNERPPLLFYSGGRNDTDAPRGATLRMLANLLLLTCTVCASCHSSSARGGLFSVAITARYTCYNRVSESPCSANDCLPSKAARQKSRAPYIQS